MPKQARRLRSIFFNRYLFYASVVSFEVVLGGHRRKVSCVGARLELPHHATYTGEFAEISMLGVCKNPPPRSMGRVFGFNTGLAQGRRQQGFFNIFFWEGDLDRFLLVGVAFDNREE